MENRQDKIVVPLYKVALDLILLLLVGFLVLILFLIGVPFKRGFFCDDESLRHPYHESTVPSYTLYIAIVFNCIVMILTEYFTTPNETQRTVYLLGYRIPPWMVNVYCVVGVFLFGIACSQLLTDIMKYTVGRLRPHFLTVCIPKGIQCNSSQYAHQYITNYTCEPGRYSDRIMKEMRLSFPSGHSSCSMYTMLYLAIYLQSRMTWNGSKFCKHTIQFGAISLAVFTAMTRVADYKHHWSDVLAGLSLGSLIACIVAFLVDPFGRLAHNRHEYERIPHTNDL